jgi:hypothetical protein
LPADADPPSALLRIALQAGIAQRFLPDAIVSAGHWLMVRDEDEAHATEHGWMERQTAEPRRTPGLMLASVLVRRFGPALLHSGSSGTGMIFAAGALLALAFGVGWFGWSTLAFCFCVPAWILRRSAAILDRINSDTLGQRSGLRSNEATFDWLVDVLMVVLLVMEIQPLPGANLMQRAFAPVVLVGLLRLLPRAFPGRWTVWLTDRAVVMAMLAVLAAGQALGAGVLLIGAALMAAGLVLPVDGDRLTRV